MKDQKSIDPRHKKRRRAVKTLFAHSFQVNLNRKAIKSTPEPIHSLAKKVISKIKIVDKIIAECAPKWPIEKINRIDLAILRLATWELAFRKKTPPKVAIDEAIELAKEFGAENSASFVNGVLGTIYKKFEEDQKK